MAVLITLSKLNIINPMQNLNNEAGRVAKCFNLAVERYGKVLKGRFDLPSLAIRLSNLPSIDPFGQVGQKMYLLVHLFELAWIA